MQATVSHRRVIPAIEIITPRTASEWSEVRGLVTEYFFWLEEVSGVSPFEVQPGIGLELKNPAAYYVHPVGGFVLAMADGDAVGMSALRVLQPGAVELKRVYVRPSARGLGLASKMLDAALEEARLLAAQRVVLETHPEVMAKAVAMYRRRGFQEIPDYSGIAAKVSGAIAMELKLAA